MRFVPGILFTAAFTAFSAIASGATAVEILPGLFIETYEDGELAVNSTISIGDYVGANATNLTKRRHEECWSNYLITHQNQEAYEDDCDNLIHALNSSPRTHRLQPGFTFVYRTQQAWCKVVVRNQSSCKAKIVADTWAGRNAQDTLNHCASLNQCSGWGYINTDTDLVYIVEPVAVAPPTYSRHC